MGKQATKAQRAHMAAIVERGCIICGGQAEIHHCGTYMGGGRDHSKVIGLCSQHHRTGGYGVAIHAGKKQWEKNYGTESELQNSSKLD